MGRKGPKAKTKTVLKLVSKMQQLGSMQNFKFETLLNKNPLALLRLYRSSDLYCFVAGIVHVHFVHFVYVFTCCHP